MLGPVPVVGRGRDVQERFYDSRRKVPQPPRRRRGRARTSWAAWPRSTICWTASTAGEIGGVWVSGGYTARLDRRRRRPSDLAAVECLVVQDMFASPLWRAGDVSTAGRGVRRARRFVRQPCRSIASVPWAIRPPAGVRVERACTGNCWRCRAWSGPAACWTKWPGNRFFRGGGRRGRSARSGFESQLAGRGGNNNLNFLQVALCRSIGNL